MSRIGKCAFVLAALGFVVRGDMPVVLHAQAPAPAAAPPSFEVASVKPRSPTSAGPRGFSVPADRLEAGAVSLRDLIAYAYGAPPAQRLLDQQIAVGEPWMTTERFDIVAKVGSAMPATAAGAAQKLLMLRQLLAERFKLAIHHETRTEQVYVLALARADGKLGPDLHPSTVDCMAIAAGGAAPPPTPQGGLAPCAGLIGVAAGSVRFRSGGETMAAFTLILSRMLNRPVIDKTGLAGGYDIDIRADSQGLEGVPAAPPGIGPPPATPATPLPSLFTALQDQFGLKLTAERAPIDVIVVDHAEHPSED